MWRVWLLYGLKCMSRVGLFLKTIDSTDFLELFINASWNLLLLARHRFHGKINFPMEIT